ncbi:MAG TPA: FAD-dependent thymidylate synthase [Vicinamibacterales bacterium]
MSSPLPHASSPTLDAGPARVTLRNAPALPYDGAIAAARTCYAPRVIGAAEITERQRETIGKLTFEAGHHTVYQHATFEFGLENVSRQFVWSALHSYPFYNSEQQSQRYVKLGEPKAYVPPLDGEARDVYERAILDAWASYARLSALLKDDTFRILKGLRNLTPRASADRLKAVEREAEKKAIETARYVIPVAAHTAMVHTISGLTLYRLLRMARASDTPHEARAVIGAMVEAVRQHDPAFIDRIDIVALEADEVVEYRFPKPRAGGDEAAARFDREMGGRVATLVDWSPNAEAVIADAVRAVFGADDRDLPDDEALDRLLNPARNPYRLDTINVAYHSPLMRTLQHASYTFRKRLSHTADSQDQRHRMVPGSRPLMAFTDTRRPDVVTPRMIRANPAALAEYNAAIARAWEAKNRLLDLGVPLEFAQYLLPNAKVIRFVESGQLIALLHKWTMRTCFNAQEEIYAASMEEIEQVRAVHPRLTRFIGPPCVVRNGLVSPRCTEGTKFCGVPVWRDFPHATRLL